MGEKEATEGWKSIKVKGKVYNDLKRMGKGVGKAVEILVKDQQEAFEHKLEDIEEVGKEIASILFESGVFDIKFAGAGIEDIEEDGELLVIKGYINVEIPNEEARAQIIDTLLKREEENGGEEEKGEQVEASS